MLSGLALQIAVLPFLRDLLLVLTGGVLAVGGNWAVYWLRRRRRRQDLRTALITEMKAIAALDDWIENYPHKGKLHAPAVDTIPKEVYRNNTDRLGLLPEVERTKVIEYYTFAQIVSQQVELLNRRAEQGVHSGEDYNTLHDAAIELRQQRNVAVEALGGE